MLNTLSVNKLSIVTGSQWHLGDCLDIIPRLQDGSIDLILTDPPYGFFYMSRSHKLPITTVRNDRHEAMPLFRKMLSAVYPKLKDDGVLLIFTNWQCYASMAAIIEEEGYEIKNVLIWEKNAWSRGDLKGNWGYKYEMCLFCRKKSLSTKLRRALFGKREGNILKFDKLPTNKYTHPTEKPVPLLTYLIEKVTKPGEVVLDPFMGSGSTIEAAQKTGRIGIGIELELVWFAVARKRLEMPEVSAA